MTNNENGDDSYDSLSVSEQKALWTDLFPNYSEQEIEDALEGA